MTLGISRAREGYVADVVREMYGNSLPHAASQLLREHARGRSSSAPPPQKLWSTGLQERRLASRVQVKVPRVGQRKSEAGLPPRAPGKKSHAQILLDTSNYDGNVEPPALRGRECGEVEKLRLQNQYGFGFGSALPTTGRPVGLAENDKVGSRHVSFMPNCGGSLPSSREVTPIRSGLSSEHERIAKEIVAGVHARQRELVGVEDSLVELVQLSEAQSKACGAGSKVRKQMVDASKRRLELKNAISRDIHDLDTLLELAPVEN